MHFVLFRASFKMRQLKDFSVSYSVVLFLMSCTPFSLVNFGFNATLTGEGNRFRVIAGKGKLNRRTGRIPQRVHFSNNIYTNGLWGSDIFLFLFICLFIYFEAV